jgi:hypothetical protein
MLVVSYLNGIPPGNTNPEKPEILKKFIAGVNRVGLDTGQVSRQWQPMACDVAILQGFVHKNSKNTRHLMLRKDVLSLQKFNNKRTVVIDSNLFLYRDPGNTKKYLRYSYDGVFPTTGEYCNNKVDPTRWEKIKSDLNFDLQPWKFKGSYILICAQRDGGWSMNGKSVVEWVTDTVSKVRTITTLPIKVRLHPGDGQATRYARKLQRLKIEIIDSKNVSLLENLQDAHSLIVYNSSPAVAGVIEGVPTFITDPDPLNCQAFGVAHTDLQRINSPVDYDRNKWILQMAQMHWNQDDLFDGSCWRWMRNWGIK